MPARDTDKLLNPFIILRSEEMAQRVLCEGKHVLLQVISTSTQSISFHYVLVRKEYAPCHSHSSS